VGTPSSLALSLILGAALLHAIWNALIKGSGNRGLTMGMINIGHGFLGLAMILLYSPPAVESWPFIAASTFIHFFYYVFLVAAYRYGDLSQVYPVARGVAPVLVALGAQVFAGEFLPPLAWVGILLVSFGTGSLVFVRAGVVTSRKATAAALVTGLTIAAYSVADGLGVRVSQSPLGYIGWLFLFECMAGFGFLWYERAAIPAAPRGRWLLGLAGGLISATAYGMAIYAKDLTTLGTVSAIRESSVIIAALIGVIWFRERPWKMRVAAAFVVAAGVILLANAGSQS